jgi:hypothetical protein
MWWRVGMWFEFFSSLFILLGKVLVCRLVLRDVVGGSRVSIFF